MPGSGLQKHWPFCSIISRSVVSVSETARFHQDLYPQNVSDASWLQAVTLNSPGAASKDDFFLHLFENKNEQFHQCHHNYIS